MSTKHRVFEPLESRVLLSVTDLDTSFGSLGRRTIDFNAQDDAAEDVAVQKDGKIVVVGEAYEPGRTIAGLQSTNSGTFAAVARFNADGSPDDGSANDSTPTDSFGTAGKVIIRYSFTAIASSFNSVGIQSDGKILLAGNVTTRSRVTFVEKSQGFLVRLNSDGNVDSSYGASGYSTVYLSDRATTQLTKMLLQPDGKSLIVGEAGDDWLIGRVNSNGYFDTTFGEAPARLGYRVYDLGGSDWARGVAVDSIGRIIVAGEADDSVGKANIAVGRFLSDGALDRSFGTNGQSLFYSKTEYGREANAVAVLPDGRICVVGSLQNMGGLVYEFDASGRPAPKASGFGYELTDIAVTVDGRVVVGGTRKDLFFLKDLSDDSPGVSLVVNVGTGYSRGAALAVAPDGSIIQAGFANVSNGAPRDFALLKFQGVSPAPFGSISGNVFSDLDGDGVRDTNEAGIPGARVFMDINKDGLFKTDGFTNIERCVVTDTDGNYKVTGLRPGTYRFASEPFPTYTRTYPTDGPNQTPTVVVGKTTSGVRFGQRPIGQVELPNAIYGSVFNDRNANGKRDITTTIERDLSGRTIYLDTNNNAKFDIGEPIQQTDSSGNYGFTGLRPGTYRVRQVVAKGWRISDPSSGYFRVDLTAGGIGRNKRFANTQTVLISGTLFNDLSGDQRRQSAEPGLSAWRVFIDGNDNGNFDPGEKSTLTDSKGNWRFNALPAGTFLVRVVRKSGWRITTPGAVLNLALASGQTAQNKLLSARAIS
ncbi:MAG: SdrD B-like domain-containing protein [Tepidisphaeraceae bacterium]